MSLNGLDSPAVQDAYQRTVAEAGGWYLLKYTSRDSVELLSSGKRGVSEARDAIAKYEEPSPLYGLIIYRRRKVLIKYIPDGTSRVLKARTAVHFQDVLEKYSPYETLLEITTADGLNDTSLAAVFPLHTAATSAAATSASNSKLNEISEDQEDDSSLLSPQVAKSSSYFGSKRPKKDRRSEQNARVERPPPPPAIQVNNELLPRITPGSPLSSPKKTTVSQYLVRDESGQTSITSLGSSSVTSAIPYAGSDMSSIGAESAATTVEPPLSSPKMKDLPRQPSEDALVPQTTETPSSRSVQAPEVRIPNGMPEQAAVERDVADRSASERPTTSERPDFDDDPYDVRKYDYLFKPKVKLGPRPVAAAEVTKRPAVASVSIPPTYRPTVKKQEPPRQNFQAPAVVTSSPFPGKNLPAPPPIPDTPEYNPRPLSRGSVKSLPSHKSVGMTPDKLRLMKAVELRKKQLRKSNPQAGLFVPPSEPEIPAVPKLPETPTKQDDIHKALEKATQVDMLAQEEKRASKKPDSGIEMDYDKGDTSEEKKVMDERRAAEMRLAAAEAPATHPEVQAQSTKESSMAQPESREPVSSSRDALKQEPPRQIAKPASPTSEAEPEPALASPALLASSTPPPIFRSRDQSAQETRKALEETSGGLGISPSSQGEPANVPSIVMADGTEPSNPTVKRTRAEEDSPSVSDAEAKSAQGASSSSALLDSSDKNLRHQTSDIARRRRGFVEPIHLDDDELSSDEEFMEELQSATVHQAKPMTVAKSPVATYFPRRPSGYSMVSDSSAREVNAPGRSSTMPMDFADMHDRLSPDPATDYHSHTRSASTPPTEKADPLSIRRNVSNGIYQRVQNLASSRETSPQPSPTTTRPLSPEVAQGGFGQSKPPNTRNNSFKAVSRHSSRMSSYQGPSAVGSFQQSNPTPVLNVHHDAATNRESVSVTARIVRPIVNEQADSADPAEVDLQQSQLLINHKRGAPSPTKASHLPPLDTNPPLPASKTESIPSRATSPTVARASTSTDGHRALHSASKFGRHKADSGFSPIGPTDRLDDFPPPPTHRTNSIPSNDENAAPKESTRTSRFFKRMSNIGSKRRSGAQDSHASKSEANSERASVVTNSTAKAPGSRERDRSDLPPAVVVGDLNIQFPDSLLWKRRIVEIDDSGCVLFSIPQPLEHQRGVVKKFAFADFKMPYVPDLERQELPNSILLDFHDGTSLQVACEDTMTHRQVVHVLKSYWKAWMA